MSDTAVKVEGLHKRYHLGSSQGSINGWLRRCASRLFTSTRDITESPGIWALRDLSFEIQRGEVFGVIGTNGSGKSTLLKILSRVTHPTKGRAIIKGRFCGLLEVGTGFHPELTGRDNIYMSGAILGMKRREIDRKFEEIVEFAEVGEFIDTPVKHYSSGMYVRLGFSVLAHMDPDILIVDEVLAVGDVRFQKKCMGKMEDVGQHGRTVILVSHDMQAITRLCKRAMLLSRGELIKEGPAYEVVNDYDERKLAFIFRTYGEVDNAGKVAKLICSARENAPIKNTGELKEAIKSATPKFESNRYLAKVFQALRMEVNGEMEALQECLTQCVEVLKPGGRLVIMSYHSLEDRLVKNIMKTGNIEGKEEKDIVYGTSTKVFKLITSKPIVLAKEEIEINSRARSAKLRVAEKL